LWQSAAKSAPDSAADISSCLTFSDPTLIDTDFTPLLDIMTKSQKELDNLLSAYYKEEKATRFNGSASGLGEYLSRLERPRRCYAPLFADNTVDEEAMVTWTLTGDAAS
jgi:hypothetical protein